MHFFFLIVAGLSAVATALPQRSAVQGRSRVGRPSDEIAQGSGVQAADPSGIQSLPTGATPGNTQAGVGQGAATEGNLNNQGDLTNQGAGNVNSDGTLAGNAGQNQKGPNQNSQNQNGQNQNGQNQNGQNHNGQNQNGGVQNGQTQNGGNQNSQNPNGGGANQTTGGFDASLVPEFGIEAGQSPDGTGNCLGLNNVKIPCSCPPDRQEFIQKVQAAAAAGNSEGVPVKFPLDDSSASQKARIGTSIIVLQNLNGRGVGCPAASTTFLAQQAAA